MRNALPQIIILVGTIAVAGLLGAGIFLGSMHISKYLSLKQTEVRNQAIDGCAEVSQNTFTTGVEGQSSVINDINQAPYQKCLELKNIQ